MLSKIVAKILAQDLGKIPFVGAPTGPFALPYHYMFKTITCPLLQYSLKALPIHPVDRPKLIARKLLF
jgi:hypothetical protein